MEAQIMEDLPHI